MAIRYGQPTAYAPRHSTGALDLVPTQATCKCSMDHAPFSRCPRHSPVNYADYMARHATDSI